MSNPNKINWVIVVDDSGCGNYIHRFTGTDDEVKEVLLSLIQQKVSYFDRAGIPVKGYVSEAEELLYIAGSAGRIGGRIVLSDKVMDFTAYNIDSLEPINTPRMYRVDLYPILTHSLCVKALSEDMAEDIAIQTMEQEMKSQFYRASLLAECDWCVDDVEEMEGGD